MNISTTKHAQAGVFLIEALIGILIFFIGALAMIGLQANSIAAQSDAQYRIEAANLVDQIIGTMTTQANRSTATNLQTSLALYAHNAGTVSPCSFNGGASANAVVTAWAANVAARLPGAAASMQQIVVDSLAVGTDSFNRVTVTVCWQTAADANPRRHSVIAYIN